MCNTAITPQEKPEGGARPFHIGSISRLPVRYATPTRDIPRADALQANACKIAALQILGAVDVGEGRARALVILAEPARPLMLKVSALATLGACGQTSDRDTLLPFLDSPDYRLRTAARAAVAKLEKATS